MQNHELGDADARPRGVVQLGGRQLQLVFVARVDAAGLPAHQTRRKDDLATQESIMRQDDEPLIPASDICLRSI